MTAATTLGRVPLAGPGEEYTLMPTTSRGLTRLAHARAVLVSPVSLRMPSLTSSRTFSGWA